MRSSRVAFDLPCDDPDAGVDEYARVVAAARLDGEQPIAIEGGHSLFLARPAELADVLSRLV